MQRRQFLSIGGGALAAAAFGGAASGAEQPAPARPNILWITCEDTSPHLGCYGVPGAHTPNLDQLAAEGARYDCAFSVAGVCAPSRSCLITGMYPTSLGTCHMRCQNPPPPHVRCFPAYLRDAGYYCTNNVKTDYNFPVPDDAWDECSNKAHFRKRPDPAQPFFAVFNFTTTHESQIGTLPKDLEEFRERAGGELHDPDALDLPPYFPDTPLIRRHWAHYFDLVTIMDRQAGEILQQLEEDGLAENTVVFFYGDHGVGLPRCKRWMYDCGIQAPLIIRWPGRIEPGVASGRLVSFVDFGPTVLSIAGVAIPDHMQGRAFLGAADTPPREYVYAARDRMDERYDLIRAIRDKQYKYIRNYEPDKPYAQYLSYPESYPVLQDMRRVEQEGALTDAQKLFFREAKPLEELYDTDADPHELNNLADDPAQAERLARLRQALDAWLDDARDVGFVPEMELDAWRLPGGRKDAPAPETSYAAPTEGEVFGRSLADWTRTLNGGAPLVRLKAVASLGLAGEAAVPVLIPALDDPDSAVAYWAAKRLGVMDSPGYEAVAALERTLARSEPSARLAAADALCRQGRSDLGVPVLLDAMSHENQFARLFAVTALERVTPRTEAVQQALTAATEDTFDYVVRVSKKALGITPQR